MYNRTIANAAILVMLFFVLSRVTGLAREIVIGAQFGTSAELDAYLAAFRIPDLLFQLVAGGALGSAFIPIFATRWLETDKQDAWLLFSRVLNLVTVVLVMIALGAVLMALPLVQFVIAPDFPPAQQILTANLMRWMLLGTVVFGASGLIMGALNATQHFLLPAAAPVFYNLAIIVGAWLLAPHWGIYGLVSGVVVGALAHLLIQIPGLLQKGVRYQLSLGLDDAGVREVMRLMGPRVLGLLFVQLHFLVNTILASGLATGSLSALNYAWLLMLLPQGVFAQAIATAAFPTFAAQVAAGEKAEMQKTFGQILRMILFLTIPAAVGLFMLRFPLIQLLLERGQFTSQSTAMVAYALQFYAAGLIAHAVVEIAVRAFYALHDTLTPVFIGVVAMLINIGFSLWWVNRWGYGGLALANSVATSLEMIVLLWLLRRRMGGIEARRLLLAVVRCTLAALLMAVGTWTWLRWFGVAAIAGGAPTQEGWFVAIGGMAIAVLIYGVVSITIKSEEVRPIMAIVLRR